MSNKAKVLVVDDQLGIRKLIEEALSSGELEICSVGKSTEAIANMKSFEPDVILLDLKMPDMNGLDIIRKMKTEEIAIPIILMTAYGELELVEEAKELGVENFLTKPFDLTEMEELVESVLKS